MNNIHCSCVCVFVFLGLIFATKVYFVYLYVRYITLLKTKETYIRAFTFNCYLKKFSNLDMLHFRSR